MQAVIENVPLKQKIFSEIEKACPPHCILATNTSTIDLNLIGEKIKSQDRVIGAHFFRLSNLFSFSDGMLYMGKSNISILHDYLKGIILVLLEL